MKVRNRMKELMREHDIKTVLEISEKTGLYYGTLLNFYHERFEVFNAPLVAGLCEFFNCKIGDLLILDENKAS